MRNTIAIDERKMISHRSGVPDLLFDDVRDERIMEIAPWIDRPWELDETAPLHRVTVFLTYRCDLACPYCKTIARSAEDLALFPQKKITFTRSSFTAMLDPLPMENCRHLHFTGGEASLVPGIDRMIGEAHDRGADYVSITTNGTREPDRYLRMIEEGLDEARVSIDAADHTLGEILTARGGAWSKTIRTIHELSAERRRGANFFLILNTVVTMENRSHLPAILDFLLALGVDDIKLITDVDRKSDLAAFKDRARIQDELDALVSSLPEASFPLLRRKLRTVFAPESIGMGSADGHPDFRCYIPLTERTVDGAFYYPCSVYLREGGKPIGRIDEPAALQREKTAEFVVHGECGRDPICRNYCLHCTREFNIQANALRSAQSRSCPADSVDSSSRQVGIIRSIDGEVIHAATI